MSTITILLHSSKAMRSTAPAKDPLSQPELLDRAQELGLYLKGLNSKQLAQVMKISPALAGKTHQLIANWTTEVSRLTPAVDSFIGDIYSGLQVKQLTATDRDYAQKTLRILSGLYGILRPLDGIVPYRLEMGYRLLKEPYTNLYKFWGESIAKTIPAKGPIINLAAVEYSKTVTPFITEDRIITPSFLTASPQTGEPAFVAVHAKIARGAFARWLIVKRISEIADLQKFHELGYAYNKKLSTPAIPVFVCQEFGGLGLSVRLQK